MRKKHRFTALALAAAVSAVSTFAPVTEIKAEELSGAAMSDLTEEELDEAAAIADGVEIVELPEENGAYVVYMENSQTADITLENEVQEIAVEAPEVILEADLSKQQAIELEQLSSQCGDILVEENFFLEGASTVGTGEERDGKSDNDENQETGEENIRSIEEMDMKSRHEWKQKLINGNVSGENEAAAEWNVQMIHADEVSGEMNGAPVKVAVLDSGVEFLAGIPIEKSINLVKEEQDLPYYMNDMTGHGTAIADIIHQICPQAQIYSVKVMDSRNRGRLSDIVAGIYWCIEQDVDIINMSFGTDVKSEILEKAIQAAAEQGIMLVSSAGNGGTGSGVEYPAAFAEVIAVGAVDTSAEKTEESATGAEVELTAPGEQIAAKSMLGLETVTSGTSMAAPHVTGAAALLLQQSEAKDAAFIRRVLNKSSNPLGNEEYYGSGLLDVSYAQELLQEYEEIVMSEEKEEAAAEESAITAGEPTEISGDITVGEAQETEDDFLDGAEQTSRPIETFEEVDYVEGRWSGPTHTSFVEAWIGDYNFTKQEINIFKAGAVYPDTKLNEKNSDTGYDYPEWHGRVRENYIANYIFATRIAKKAGDTTNLAKVDGQKNATYTDMKNSISDEKLYGVPWKKIMLQIEKINSYDGNKRWRQIFLYGMALHTATDAFAHSSYYVASDGSIKKFYHSRNDNFDPNYSADNINSCPNRWKSATYIAEYTIINCKYQWVGEAADFSAYGEEYWGGFLMGKIYYYAIETVEAKDYNYMEKLFKNVALMRHIEWDTEREIGDIEW